LSAPTQLVRGLALVWLVGVAPFDLAATIARHLPRLLGEAGPAFLVLALARMATVALGVAVGVSLMRRAPATRTLANLWLVAEGLTLGLVWTSGTVPSNRPPGLMLPLVGLYVVAGGTVWLAAWATPPTDS
jgi:hypothetical protein